MNTCKQIITSTNGQRQRNKTLSIILKIVKIQNDEIRSNEY